MSTTMKIAWFEVRDVLRSRWLIGYMLFFVLVADALLRFGSGEKSLLSLVNIVLFVTPLVTLVFATVYQYNSREFIELLLAQPVQRRQMFGGLYLGITVPVSAVFIAGIAVPVMIHRADNAVAVGTLLALLGSGVALTAIFTAFALLIVARVDDRLKGLGLAIVLWLVLTVLYDGIVLLAASILADHAIERPLLALMVANPVDLARVSLLLQCDISALLGYTGAAMRQFFGGSGTMIAAAALGGWVAGPLVLAYRSFGRKDF
jgi:Cu-processing system permease protein